MYIKDCKSVYLGSTPGRASIKNNKLPTILPRIKYQINRENYFLYDIVNDNYSELSIIMTVEKLRYWLSFIIAAVAVFFFMNQFGLFDKNIEKLLFTMSKEINKNTPYQLDQFTILDSTTAYKNTIVYKMTIFNVNIKDSEMDFVKNKLFLKTNIKYLNDLYSYSFVTVPTSRFGG